MVAISLYRGNLHKVPDVPRTWLVPTPKISRKDFKNLLHRRARALSRLSEPNPNPQGGPLQVQITDCRDEHVAPDSAVELSELKVCDVKVGNLSEGEKLVEQTDAVVDVKREEHVDGEGNAVVKDQSAVPIALPAMVLEGEEKAQGGTGNPSSPQGMQPEKKEEVQSEKEKRKREIEAKLKVLNEKKHSLVQILKQILSAEEELKGRSSVQGMGVRPPVSLQVDTTHDPGSGSRLNTPRMGSDGNVANEVEGGETDDVNHIAQSRHLHRTSSTSPSSDSQQKRPAFSTVPLVSRANSGVAANSPSRFALSGQQGRPSSLPTVSISGTNYMASSPSPAASGATSAFRDGRIPSPWN